MMARDRVLRRGWLVDIEEEARRAIEIHGTFQSPHEGYAVILEELDELWDVVKKVKRRDDRPLGLTKEAIQVGAMALKFLNDFGGFDI